MGRRKEEWEIKHRARPLMFDRFAHKCFWGWLKIVHIPIRKLPSLLARLRSHTVLTQRPRPRMPLDVRYRVCCSTRATAYAARRMLPRMPLNARYCVCRSTCVTTYPARRASPQRAHAWVVTQGFHKYGTVVLCACSAHLLRFEIGIERTAREGVFITNEDIMSQVH